MDILRKIKIDPNSKLGRSIIDTLDDKNVVYENTFQFIERIQKEAKKSEMVKLNVQPQAAVAF